MVTVNFSDLREFYGAIKLTGAALTSYLSAHPVAMLEVCRRYRRSRAIQIHWDWYELNKQAIFAAAANYEALS